MQKGHNIWGMANWQQIKETSLDIKIIKKDTVKYITK